MAPSMSGSRSSEFEPTSQPGSLDSLDLEPDIIGAMFRAQGFDISIDLVKIDAADNF